LTFSIETFKMLRSFLWAFALSQTAFPALATNIKERSLLQRDDPVTSLVGALAQYPQVSGFSSFITLNPGAFDSLLPNNTNTGVTVLVPSNTALTTYESKYGVALANLPQDKIHAFLQYLVLVAPLTSANFSKASNGLIVPTLLTDTQYNNRSAGEELLNEFGKNSNGQVLYFSPDTIPTSKKMLVRVRQSQTGLATNVRAGVSEVTTIDVIDGKWSGGTFQIVNE
jgi:hypothetical protein